MIKILNMFNNFKLTTNQLVIYTCVYFTLILNLPFLSKTTAVVTTLESYNFFFLTFCAYFFTSTLYFYSKLFILSLDNKTAAHFNGFTVVCYFLQHSDIRYCF